MATSIDFARYVCEQIADAGTVRYKKMFGEYMIYVDDKPLLLVCDNIVYVKITPCTAALLSSADTGVPYPHIKP